MNPFLNWFLETYGITYPEYRKIFVGLYGLDRWDKEFEEIQGFYECQWVLDI